ncbi:MAG: hypothetical protein JSR58_08250 [Verrucomicrobia bacterium]|nr:hypothetical protein [Verrucomicrobiota bacterium]
MADIVGVRNAGVEASIGAQEWIESNKLTLIISRIWEDNFTCCFTVLEDFPTADNVFQYDYFKNVTRESSWIIVPVWDGKTVRGLVIEGKIRQEALKEDLYQLIRVTLGNENCFEKLIWSELKGRIDNAPSKDRLAAVCAIWKEWSNCRNKFSTNRSVWDFREYHQEQGSYDGVAFRFVRSAEFIFSLKDIPHLSSYAVQDELTVVVFVNNMEAEVDEQEALTVTIASKFKALENEYPSLQFSVERPYSFSPLIIEGKNEPEELADQ